MMQRLKYATAAVLVLTAAAACDNSRDPEEPAECKTFITGHSSPAPGVLTLTGDFFSDETVLLRYTSGGHNQQLTLTPATDRTQVTFTGLPSGSIEIDVLASCDEGQQDLGTKAYDIP
jgi:hypothetical protein